MDGDRLISLYRLCCTNSALMLQNLRSETKDFHATPLSTNTYLKFIDEMNRFLGEDEHRRPVRTGRSQICTLL